MLNRLLTIAVAATATLASSVANAETGETTGVLASDQSPARPMGLPLVGQVYETASDARSEEFASDLLPKAMAIVNKNLAEKAEFIARGITRLDTDKLYLMRDTVRSVRVYFLSEGASSRNSLGVSASLAGSDQEGERQLIFPDISDGTFGGPKLLRPGQWVDLGHFRAGTQIEFFVVKNGAYNHSQFVFTNKDERNYNGIQHMVAWLLGDRYVLVGFETMVGGGDLDYNDAVFVVDLQDGMGRGSVHDFLPR